MTSSTSNGLRVTNREAHQIDRANRSGLRPVVLIHGLWMTPLSWEHWVDRYETMGVVTLTPGYPAIEDGVAGVRALRRDPSSLAGLGVREVMDHLIEIVSSLEVPPVLIGHSTGGAFVQLLLDAGYGAAGVSIDGAPVKGLLTTAPSQIKATFPLLHDQRNMQRAVPITPEQFHYAFTNTLSDEESRKAYDRYAVPVPGRILFESGLANLAPTAATVYNFANDDRAPLLFISGGSDHILPPSVQRENYTKNTKHSQAITAYKLFPGRDHFTCGEHGWQRVADFALAWARDPRPGELDR